MTTYIEVVVNVPQIQGVYHYHLPTELEGQVSIGHLVQVPFGSQSVQGVVTGFPQQPAVSETLPVSELIDPAVTLTAAQISLAQQLAEHTLAPLSAFIALMIPVGLAQQADMMYTLANKHSKTSSQSKRESGGEINVMQVRLLKILGQRGPLRGRQLDRALPRQDWRSAMYRLQSRGLVEGHSVLPPPSVQPKSIHTAQLAVSRETVLAALPDLGRKDSPALARRQAILQILLREKSPVEATWVYAESGGKAEDLRWLAERELVTLSERETWRDPLAGLPAASITDKFSGQPPPLTPDQQAVWKPILAGLQAVGAGKTVKPYLLHGVTGSGKTEIYLHAVQAALQLGRQAIVLVPEIALTPQTINRFVARFPGRVGLVHSRLSPGERYDTWRRARLGLLDIVVGPRSALFTPFAKLGLIVVDEFHDDTYFQSEFPPPYHARQAAILYARLCGALCILGSATPDIASRYQAERGRWNYLRLPGRILAHRQALADQVEQLHQPSAYRPYGEQAEMIDLPPVKIIDMRNELKAGNRSIFSRSLQAALGQALDRQQQAILFLNRRGAATHVFCRDCGFTIKCPRCDLPLTYHQPPGGLTCHYCGYQRQVPKTCPQCQSNRFRQYGSGTEKVQAEVEALYPAARTLRWDYESTRLKGAHEIILDHFVHHRADILIGTQMVAKGLDLPLVTLVGVVLADVGLGLPDPRAAERTFQVLTQVAGRAGRSPLGGQVILQTFQPDHYVIQAAERHDYDAFYRQELAYRRQLGYPPFARLVRLEYRHLNAQQAEQAAQKMAEQLQAWLEAEQRHATEMIGPAPCFFGRLSGLYRWQIVLRGPDPASLLRGRSLRDWHIEVDPPSLL
jgi:primosomal protein N' (replication factor Y)